jgi:hypothetical protein
MIAAVLIFLSRLDCVSGLASMPAGDQKQQDGTQLRIPHADHRSQVESKRAQIAAPDFAVSDVFLWDLVRTQMTSDPAWDEPSFDPDHPEIRDRFWQRWQMHDRQLMQGETARVLEALPRKTGGTRAMTLYGLLRVGMEADPVLAQKVRPMLISAWNDLPEKERNYLIEYRWRAIAGPEMLPILRGMLAVPLPARYTSEATTRNAALRGLNELDPATARRLILEDLPNVFAQPSLDVVELLPQQDIAAAVQGAVDRLASGSHLGPLDLVLLDRFGDVGHLEELRPTFDKNIGRWWCAGQSAALRYLLRVAPEYGLRKLEAALQSRETGCYKEQLTQLGNQFPPAQRIAIKALDDPDPYIVFSAVAALGRHGSPDVESLLWARLERLHRELVGHQDQLKVDPNHLDYAGLQQQLVNAISLGLNWICPPEKLRKLHELALTDDLRQLIEVEIKEWSKDPMIRPWWSWSRTGEAEELPSFSLLQYHVSAEGLRTKLSQLPRGTQLRYEFLPPAGRVQLSCVPNDECRMGKPDGPPVSLEKQEAIYERMRVVAEKHGVILQKYGP